MAEELKRARREWSGRRVGGEGELEHTDAIVCCTRNMFQHINRPDMMLIPGRLGAAFNLSAFIFSLSTRIIILMARNRRRYHQPLLITYRRRRVRHYFVMIFPHFPLPGFHHSHQRLCTSRAKKALGVFFGAAQLAIP